MIVFIEFEGFRDVLQLPYMYIAGKKSDKIS